MPGLTENTGEYMDLKMAQKKIKSLEKSLDDRQLRIDFLDSEHKKAIECKRLCHDKSKELEKKLKFVEFKINSYRKVVRKLEKQNKFLKDYVRILKRAIMLEVEQDD